MRSSIRHWIRLVEGIAEYDPKNGFFFGNNFDPAIKALILENTFRWPEYNCLGESEKWLRHLEALDVPLDEIELCQGYYRGLQHFWLRVKAAIFDPTARQLLIVNAGDVTDSDYKEVHHFPGGRY